MVGLKPIPLRNFTNARPRPQCLGDNPRLHLFGPLSIAPPPPAICEKLHWSVHGETPALTSISAQSHGSQHGRRWGWNSAYGKLADALRTPSAAGGRLESVLRNECICAQIPI